MLSIPKLVEQVSVVSKARYPPNEGLFLLFKIDAH